MKHKYHDVIVAFAEGKTVQQQNDLGNWTDWTDEGEGCPSFNTYHRWRVKPGPVRAVFDFYAHVVGDAMYLYKPSSPPAPNVRFTFEDNVLVDAEVIK